MTTGQGHTPSFRGIMQIAYIVPDLKAAIEQYVSQMKIGPWFVSDHFAGEQKTYRGAPTDVDMTIAMSYSNQMCIELIQQLNDTPSVYTAIRDRQGYGFHHWGVGTYEFERDAAHYRANGCALAFYTMLRGAPLAYFDTTAQLPGMVELIEMNKMREDMFTMMYEASLAWDGGDPVRARR
jgi:Glyoxalase/Bleomycin resistance protein/Dioxygenase superfamily